ncbi:MAG: YbjN domain-containing protein [Candidatus Eremiobacterota bacterium]
MYFTTPAQEECYRKVQPWIVELFGDNARARADEPVFDVTVGSSVTEVGVFPWTQEESVVSARARVIRGVELSPDLLQYLLRQNSVIRFGAFGVESDSEIYFLHSIVGSTCDKPELAATVRSVSSMADRYDDEIRNRWGGHRAIDAT